MIVEIVNPQGKVSYTRPHDHPDVLEAFNTPGYSVRGSEAAAADSLKRAVRPHLVAEIEGTTERELWQNLNWLLCNALDSKNEHGEWPKMVSETYRGKLEVRSNDQAQRRPDPKL